MFEAPSVRIMAAVSTYLLGAATSEWPVYENGTKEIMAPPRVSGITTHNATMFGTTLPRVETRCLGYLTLISSSHLISHTTSGDTRTNIANLAQRITETMLRHVEGLKVVYLLMNIRHNG